MDFDISVQQGATFKMILTIKDPDENPIDLSGYLFRGQVRQTYSSEEIEAEFSFTVLPQEDATLGQVECVITAEESAGITVPGACNSTRKSVKMIYDIESQIADEVTRWLQGTAEISPEVTKDVD